MSLFQPASAVERRLKVLAYGPPGTGKTWFGLSFSEAGRLAVIDTEGGTALYGSKFQFDVLRTKDFAQVMAAVEEIKRDGGKTFAALMIDPITVLWQTLQDAGQLLAERRQGKTGIADVVLTQRDWGIIKRQYARLMTELVNLPLHVVLVAREKDVMGANDQRQGVKPDAEKSTPYLPDIILRFTSGSDHVAIVEKDRSGTYALGTKVGNPSFASFKTATSHGATIALPSEDDAASGTAALLAPDMPPSEAPAPAQPSRPPMPAPQTRPASANAQTGADAPATDRQIVSIGKLCVALNRPMPATDGLTFEAAKGIITELSAAYSEMKQGVASNA